MSMRKKREAPKPPRPLSKPPPPPKPEHLTDAAQGHTEETAALVHVTSRVPHPGVPPPYSRVPLSPSRSAPPPPSAPGQDTLQRPAQSLPAKTPPDDVIMPVSEPEVFAGVPGRLPLRTNRNRNKDIELQSVPDVTQTLLTPRKDKMNYDPMELPPPDYFVLSLITCLCCCLPIGLIALIFSICSSNASGVGKTRRGRVLGHVALALCILGILAAVGTALGLYFSGAGEVLYIRVKALILGNTTAPSPEPEVYSSYNYQEYGGNAGGNKGGGNSYAYYDYDSTG